MKYKVTCPYCGAPAVCIPAGSMFGSNVRQKGDYIYRCSRWPVCDAYVSAHRRDRRPMGTLANASLRRKRIQAHRALDAMCRNHRMEKWAAYVWLQCKLRMEESEVHIGLFTEEQCDRVIALCTEFTFRPNRTEFTPHPNHSTYKKRSANEKEYSAYPRTANAGRKQPRGRYMGPPGEHLSQREGPRPRV